MDGDLISALPGLIKMESELRLCGGTGTDGFVLRPAFVFRLSCEGGFGKLSGLFCELCGLRRPCSGSVGEWDKLVGLVPAGIMERAEGGFTDRAVGLGRLILTETVVWRPCFRTPGAVALEVLEGLAGRQTGAGGGKIGTGEGFSPVAAEELKSKQLRLDCVGSINLQGTIKLLRLDNMTTRCLKKKSHILQDMTFLYDLSSSYGMQGRM